MPNTGAAAKLGIGAGAPVSNQLEFVSETLALQEQVFVSHGVRGSRSRYSDRPRVTRQSVGGSISLQPNANEILQVMPWIFSNAATGTGPYTFTLGESALTKTVTVDRVTKVATYAGCGINSASIRCSQGEPLGFDLNIIGQTETIANAGTFPAISVDIASGPFVFSDLVLTVGGTAVQMKSFDLTVNNFIDADRFFNSLNLTSVNYLDREVTLNLSSIPYTEYVALYASGGGAVGVSVVATFTNGVFILTLTMPKVILPIASPNVPGRSEITFSRQGVCLATGPLNKDEISATLAVS